MLKKILLPVILLLLLFTSVLASAETIYFKASANKKTVTLSESFIYSVTVSGDSTNLPEYKMDAMPEFNRFGTTVSRSISVVTGKTSMSVTRDYTLGPKKIGKFTIPPAKITFKGKTYLTESVEIEVTPAQSVKSIPVVANRRQLSSQNAAAGKAFVKASINKKTAYENEKLVYKFSFYTNVDLVSNPEYYPPDFSGFWNDGSKPKNHFEVIDGSNYRVDEIETTLYPVGTGLKRILPAKLKIDLMNFSLPSGMNDFFSFFADNGCAGDGETKILEAESLEIKIIPLPKDGKPADFYGATGDFEIKAVVDKKDVRINEPVTLTVTVSGSGNMKSISDINFGVYNDFKKYDTIVESTSGNSKKFKTIFIPLVSGEKEIPAASLSFFSPLKKQYETIKTSSQKIIVSGMSLHTEENVEDKLKIDIMHKDINYNKRIKTLKLYRGYLIEKPVFYLIFAPFIMLFILSVCYAVYMRIVSRNPFKKLKTLSFAEVQKLVKEAENRISENNFEASLDLLYQALIEIINIETGIKSDNLQKNQITGNLRKKNADDEKIIEIIKMLERFDFYKFASVNLDKDSINALLINVETLILSFKK
ncbi:hypothetical protein AGMMS5026_02120 [Endomicrobiia bacterium]|nr:hypothetical protein AGMMS49523_07970 [Endomicrobiia bacterium]GHT12522.1 hypothetical protein AGMMS49571_04640 [Endomicrobiia bacterium]GHT20072.1 hypothetical protein AGMMS49929_05460 [Endomicrobiia bacterium]GHT27189.1 hypothetical protein AGMMS49995_05600 [Endomicrobiia bacterium]GHT29806.1 hypothetical protein AGMMS5026_02120 [Endomicrobiia bacterium]